MPALKEISYSDLDIGLTAHPVTGEIMVKTNAEAVKQAIKNLILTNLGERFFHHDIGSDVRRSLFENFGRATEIILKKNIEQTINNYEPRAVIEDIRVEAQRDSNRYAVHIVFRPINLTEPVEIEFFLEKVR